MNNKKIDKEEKGIEIEGKKKSRIKESEVCVCVLAYKSLKRGRMKDREGILLFRGFSGILLAGVKYFD